MLGAGLLLSVGLANVATAVPLGPGTRLLLLALTLGLTSVLFLGAFQLLSARSSDWRELVPGAVLAGFGWVAVQSLGSLYVSRVIAGASDTYGTFALVIGLMSLLFLQAQLTILAAEVNVVCHRHLWPRSLVGDDLTDADRQALQLQTESIVRHKGQRNELHLD